MERRKKNPIRRTNITLTSHFDAIVCVDKYSMQLDSYTPKIAKKAKKVPTTVPSTATFDAIQIRRTNTHSYKHTITQYKDSRILINVYCTQSFRTAKCFSTHLLCFNCNDLTDFQINNIGSDKH